MSRPVEQATQWVYRGVWGILAEWFMVPKEPPELPAGPDDTVRHLKPSPQFLAYRKFIFWVMLTLIDGALTIGWIAILIANPLVGAILFPIYFVVAVVPDVLVYVGIHLRYDTTWYVLSNRSMRLRRGIWIIHETTITYENIQNVNISQGPLERWFGISTLTVHTAGGAGGGGGKGGGAPMGAHIGIIEGITDAPALRDELLAAAARSRSAGLGDEREPHTVERIHDGIRIGPEHVAVLAEIRDIIRTQTTHATA